MANRLNAPNQFETLSPPWILANLDVNFTQNQAAWNDSSLGLINGICTDTGSGTAYVITSGNLPFGAPSAYNPGMTIEFIPTNTNTGSATMQVGLLGTAAILTPAGNALQGGEIAANRNCVLTYSSSAPAGFRIVGPCPLSFITTTSSTTATIECAGYTSVAAGVTYTGNGIVITLSHLAQGVPVYVTVSNSSGSANGVFFNATSPSGASYVNINALPSGLINGGVAIDMIGVGVTLNNGNSMLFNGSCSHALQIVLGR